MIQIFRRKCRRNRSGIFHSFFFLASLGFFFFEKTRAGVGLADDSDRGFSYANRIGERSPKGGAGIARGVDENKWRTG